MTVITNPPPPRPRQGGGKILKAFAAILLVGGVTTGAALMMADDPPRPAPAPERRGPEVAGSQPSTTQESVDMAADLEKALAGGDDAAAEQMLARLVEGDKRRVAIDRFHLLKAVRANRVQMVAYMLDLGIDTAAVDPSDGAGNRATHLAATLDDPAMITQLVEAGRLPVDETNALGQTPLHIAAASGKSRVVEKLANDLKAKLDVQDGGGNTPLHLAAREGNGAAVEALLKAKADASIKNIKGQTPRDLAPTELKSLLR